MKIILLLAFLLPLFAHSATSPQLVRAQAPLTLTNGLLAVPAATSSVNGYLSSADWSTFNSKQGAGNYITALTGDVTASGPGSAAASISSATVTGKLLTGYVSGAGTLAATDTILQGFNKLNGNIALKADLASPTFTGIVTAPNLILSALTATTVPYLNGSKQLTSSAVTPTELGTLTGIGSTALVTLLAAKAALASPTLTGTLTVPDVLVSGLTASLPVVTDGSKHLASQSFAALTGNLSSFVGDSGSGGVKGLVPAPATGDATKYLKGDATWGTIASPAWGAITGTLSAQSDLQAAIDAKLSLAGGTMTGNIIMPGAGSYIGWGAGGNTAVSGDTTILHLWANSVDQVTVTGTSVTINSGTLSVSGAVTFADGTAGTPGWKFAGSNGAYRLGTNDWSLVAAGNRTLRMYAGASEYGVTGTYSHVFNGSSLQVSSGSGSGTAFAVTNGISTGSTVFSGDTSATTGGNLVVYGASNAKANQTEIRSGSTIVATSSSGLLAITGGITSTGHVAFGNSTAVDDMFIRLGAGTVTTGSGTTQYGIYSDPKMATSATTGYHSNYAAPRLGAGINTAVVSKYTAGAILAGTGTATRTSGFYCLTTETLGSAGNVCLTDNSGYSGNYFIHSTSSNPSLISGAMRFASTVEVGDGSSGVYVNSVADAFPSSGFDSYALFLRTGGSGSAPFDNAGSIVLRPRLSATAGRGSVYLYGGSTPTLGLRVGETGNVLMPALEQTSAPQQGTLCWATGGNVTVDTTVACLASTNRIKQNIEPLDAGLKTVMRLRPVSYEMKKEYDMGQGRMVGLVAEEVAKVDHRLVAGKDDDHLIGVRYMQMAAVLVKAIQELKTEVDSLRKKLAQ